jgi:hypothetical protein
MSEPTRDELELTARHSTNRLSRYMAIAEIAKRDGRLDELREAVDIEG